MIGNFEDRHPDIQPGVFVAGTAVVIGDVTLGRGASVWYGAVLRGDSGAIRVGDGTNIQDGAVLHCDAEAPLTLGRGVTVGHGAVVHGAAVEDDVLIGMHATLLNGCVIGAGSVIGAGALVREGQVIPPRSVVVGVPGKVVRTVSDEQLEEIRRNAAHYIGLAEKYKI